MDTKEYKTLQRTAHNEVLRIDNHDCRAHKHKSPCAVCGDMNTNRHHPDYRKALEIIWLCHTCHKQHHEDHGVENQWLGQYELLNDAGNVIKPRTLVDCYDGPEIYSIKTRRRLPVAKRFMP